MLSALKDGRRTVVMVTHNLAEGLELADHVSIQVGGRMVHYATRPSGGEGEFLRFYLDAVEKAQAEPRSTTPRGRGGRSASPEPEPDRGGPTSPSAGAEPSRPPRPRPSYLRQLGAVAWKDLLVELRTRQRLAAMGESQGPGERVLKKARLLGKKLVEGKGI